ncbi:MAG: hypothetical protein SGARI_004190, partial [Bacillariaceae sp.]
MVLKLLLQLKTSVQELSLIVPELQVQLLPGPQELSPELLVPQVPGGKPQIPVSGTGVGPEVVGSGVVGVADRASEGVALGVDDGASEGVALGS